ncbi:DUF805 domain-containing protein [Fuscibacter oryzae]|uniref:DUF805 domain-containing protein n=1 Tax=Fuscibacter oryzae TaxID=2803939 RepID=A0A8J7MSL3_9RHOB|nr:DUF805 domain-containing protein [Fuscibacter oryzae]MBL4929802.1 DUF805 domain-containing protein [Fuscibacter oryzae]
MGPAQAIRTCFAKSLQSSGRASRSEYWWFAAFVGILTTLTPAVALESSGHLTLNALVGLIMLTPVLSAGSRRFQDVSRSRWLFLALTLATGIGFSLSFDLRTVKYYEVTALQLLGFAATWFAGLWMFSILIDAPSSGPNSYGPNPLEVTK